MPPRLPDDKRRAIADAIRAGGKRNEIARQFDVSPSTVSGIAEEFNIDTAFDRTLTARASEAKRVDNAARRAELAGLSIQDALALRDRLFASSEQLTGSGQIVTLNLPPARDVRDLATAIQALSRTHTDLEKHDTTDAGAVVGAKSMLLGVAEGLRQLYQDSGMASEDGD